MKAQHYLPHQRDATIDFIRMSLLIYIKFNFGPFSKTVQFESSFLLLQVNIAWLRLKGQHFSGM